MIVSSEDSIEGIGDHFITTIIVVVGLEEGVVEGSIADTVDLTLDQGQGHDLAQDLVVIQDLVQMKKLTGILQYQE